MQTKIYVFEGVTGQVGYFFHDHPIRKEGSAGPSWNGNSAPKWVFSNNIENMPAGWQSAFKHIPSEGWHFAEKRGDSWEFSPGTNPPPEFKD